MSEAITLAKISDENYSDYRYEVIFNAYKWDPQVEDHNTVSQYVLLLDQKTASQLELWAEQLSEETMEMEEALLTKLELTKKLGFPKEIQKALPRLQGYRREDHIRLMRFDFHPTDSGWAVSEVNSDVPGGFAEATILPEIASRYFDGYEPGISFANTFLSAFQNKVKTGGTVALVHATSYSDDRQVMQYIGDYFSAHGIQTVLTGPDHLRWNNRQADCILEGKAGPIDGIIRFFPLEWLANLPRIVDWKGYYDCLTPSCNHPISIFAQSKRLPIIWDELRVKNSVWKSLLPDTQDPKSKFYEKSEYIYKPALGRVGEGISIREAISKKEMTKIEKAAQKEPKNWVAQKRFISKPILTVDNTSFHVCIGVFTVNGKRAGFYGRISPYPRIDANAKDIPIVVAKGEK